jgi:PmbA protein
MRPFPAKNSDMTQMPDSRKLIDRVAALVEAARKAGADDADAVAVRSRSKGVTVRLGKVEATEASESDDISLAGLCRQACCERVCRCVGRRAGAGRARGGMAKVSPEDPYQGLVDQSLLATGAVDLDLFDPTEVSAEEFKDAALAAEEAALAVKGVANSLGAGAGGGFGGLVLATSHGFVGEYIVSRFSRSVSVLAGEGTEDGARL